MMLNCHTKDEFKRSAFLEKFCVKESNSLISLENFGAAGFPITAGFGWYSPISKKVTNSPPIRVPLTKYLHSTHESRTTPYYYLKFEIKV